MTMSRRLAGRWNRHFLRNEFAVAVVLGVLVLVSDRWVSPGGLDSLLAGDRSVLWGTVASIAGALLGFVLAAASILVAIVERPPLRRLKVSSQYDTLWHTFVSATKWLGALTLLSLVQLTLDADHAAPARPWIYLLVGAAVLAVLRVARCVWILQNVLSLNVSGDQRPTGSDVVRVG